MKVESEEQPKEDAFDTPEEPPKDLEGDSVKQPKDLEADHAARRGEADQARKVAAKAARRKANKALKAIKTGSLVSSDHTFPDDEDYHQWQCQEIMFLKRMKRTFHAWRSGGFSVPRWSDPC